MRHGIDRHIGGGSGACAAVVIGEGDAVVSRSGNGDALGVAAVIPKVGRASNGRKHDAISLAKRSAARCRNHWRRQIMHRNQHRGGSSSAAIAIRNGNAVAAGSKDPDASGGGIITP